MNEEPKLDGIYSDGYSILPNSVLRNKEISIQAKAVYAYLKGYKGSGEYAYPSRDYMAYQLNISQSSLTKYIKELVDIGLIYKQQGRTEGNKYDNNRYYFNDDIEFMFQSAKIQTTKNPVTQNLVNGDSVSENLASNNNKNNNNIKNNNNSLNNNNERETLSLQDLKSMLTKYNINDYIIDKLYDFLEIKQNSTKPIENEITLKAIIETLNQFDNIAEQKECLLYSIRNSYPDLYPEKILKQRTKFNSSIYNTNKDLVDKQKREEYFNDLKFM